MQRKICEYIHLYRDKLLLKYFLLLVLNMFSLKLKNLIVSFVEEKQKIIDKWVSIAEE
jgi:hypothetical protein